MAEQRDLTERERQVIEEIKADLTEWADANIIGAVEAAAQMISMQEQADRWAERMNAEPLRMRLRFLDFVSDGGFDLSNVTDAKIACKIEPLEDDPTRFSMVVHADLRYRPSVERVLITFTISKGGSDG